eukprot:gene4107-6394_t
MSVVPTGLTKWGAQARILPARYKLGDVQKRLTRERYLNRQLHLVQTGRMPYAAAANVVREQIKPNDSENPRVAARVVESISEQYLQDCRLARERRVQARLTSARTTKRTDIWFNPDPAALAADRRLLEDEKKAAEAAVQEEADAYYREEKAFRDRLSTERALSAMPKHMTRSHNRRHNTQPDPPF